MRNHSFSIFLLFSLNPFQESFNVNEVIADQIARLTVFYSDLDEVGSEYKVTQTSVVNEQALKDAISDFSNVIEDFKKQLPTKHSYSSNKQI
jgi:Tfp pilus assembly protein PilO